MDRIFRPFVFFTLASLHGLSGAEPPGAAAVTSSNPQPARTTRNSANSNDVFYTLGPDSQPRPGVPQGRYTEPKVIPSNVFPGTQHTYWVYVPAQYDPAQPTALMVFNDGQAMKAEPGDVQAHHALDNLIFRREIPVMPRVFINPGRRPDQPEQTPREWGDRPNNDWFLQNVRLMQALTKKGHDLNYTWGIGNHGQKQGGAIFPEMMRWLWRDQPVSTDPNDPVEVSFRHPKSTPAP